MGILDVVRKHINQNKPQKLSFRSLANVTSEAPIITEKSGSDWVWYGEKNLYPLQLFDLKYGSAIHNSILKTKYKMMAGDGLLFGGKKTKEESEQYYNSLPAKQKAEVDWLLKNKIGGKSIDELRTALSTDYEDYGAYCYSILFNTDFTKISGIKYYRLEDIRVGKKDSSGKITNYYHSTNWAKCQQTEYKPKPIAAYSSENKSDIEQMVYIKCGNLDYYGVPPYSGCINWIHTDFQMGVFHRSNIENGMNPGLHWRFFRKPTSVEEEDEIIRNIDRQYMGASRAGQRLVSFWDGKDDAPEIQPIEVSNLDKQLIVLAELCDSKILTGHQLTTPILAGLSTPGKLGTSNELEQGYQIFDGLTMEADRGVLEKDIKFWFEYNKTGVEVAINKFKPFGKETKGSDANEALNTLSPLVATKVLEKMTDDEIRGLAGLLPTKEKTNPSTTPINTIVTNG